MRTIAVLALAAWALGFPSALRAAELTFAGEGAVEYDTNVFRSSDDEKDDFVFRLRPWAQLAEERGQDFTYSVLYAVPVELAVEHSEVNDVDQALTASGDYHINDRFDLFGRNQFRYLRSDLLTNIEGTSSAGNAALVNDERDRITMNTAVLGTSYSFTPRLIGTARMTHDLYNPSRDDRQEYWQLEGNSDLLYQLTPKHRLGGGMAIAHQSFDSTQDITASTTDVYQVYGSWIWSIDEKTDLSISAGPSLLREKQDNPNANETRLLVPFQTVSSFKAPQGFVDQDGNSVAGNFYDDAVLVAQTGDCQTADVGGTQTPVLSSGVICPLSVVIDATPGANDPLIGAIQTSVATLNNSDPHGDDSDTWTVFANATLTRHWSPSLHSAITYSRRQENASGLGGSVISDSVSLAHTWNFTEKWQFAVRNDFSLRKSVSEQTRVLVVAQTVGSPLGGQAFTVPIAGVASAPNGTGILVTERGSSTKIDTMRYGVAGQATHFFARNTSGYLRLTYNRQASKSDSLGDPSDFDDWLVTVGVQHVFEPIKLW